jgi:ferredoxin
MSYKAKVDRKLCTSVASCVAIAGNTFELDDEGISVVKKQNADSDEVILQAAESCPVDAIIIHDASGKQIYPKK